MNILKNTVIAGLPGKDARDYVRALLKATADNSGLTAAQLPLPSGLMTNKGVLAKLLDEGFVQYEPSSKAWSVSQRGLQLAGARIGNRISHKQALELAMNAIEAAKSINQLPGMLVEVKGLHAFGSILDRASTNHGDIDIGFTLANKAQEMAHFQSLMHDEQTSVFNNFCQQHNIRCPAYRSMKDLIKLQQGYIVKRLNRVSRYISAGDFTDVGMTHITGPKHLLFFSHRDTNNVYQDFAVADEYSLMNDSLIQEIAVTEPSLLAEAQNTTWSIEQVWDAKLAASTNVDL